MGLNIEEEKKKGKDYVRISITHMLMDRTEIPIGHTSSSTTVLWVMDKT